MDVSLTTDQLEWQAANARVADAYEVSAADLIPALDIDRGWSDVITLGIPSLRSPEHSGVEGTGVETALAVEQSARRLSPLPIAGQAVIAPELLEAAGASGTLDAVVEGTFRLAPAFAVDLSDFGTTGGTAVAFDAAGASHALMLDYKAEQPSLAVVALDPYDLDVLDLTRRLVSIGPVSERIDMDLGGPISRERLVRARAVTMSALAADLLGVMEAALTDAVRHAKDRIQFGVPIGSFQAVQHILADAAVAVEGARSCVWHAAWSTDRASVIDALRAARTAKAFCSAAGLRVVESTVQVFGGIAITWEHLSHLRLRRVHLDRECFGNEDVHYEAIGAARLLEGPSA